MSGIKTRVGKGIFGIRKRLTNSSSPAFSLPNQIYPLSELIKIFGSDFENDQKKFLRWVNIDTSPTKSCSI